MENEGYIGKIHAKQSLGTYLLGVRFSLLSNLTPCFAPNIEL